MRPWHFSHGNLPGLVNDAFMRAASMRPWHFSHGNQFPTNHQRQKPSGFNEAVAFQPRKFVFNRGNEDPAQASMRPWHFSHGNFFTRLIRAHTNHEELQ